MLAFVIILAYFVPSVIAGIRWSTGSISRDRFAGAALVNVLTGWTVLGWLVALGIGLTSPRAPRVVYVRDAP